MKVYYQNKYEKWYFNIIESRANNPYDGYTENHHIMPKSMGGLNDSGNMVSLSGREHYICHYLLTKFLTGQSKYKMIYAFNLMNF